MSKKEVKFTRRPGTAPAPLDAAEAWVSAPASTKETSKPVLPETPDEPMKRLTIDIPESLHIRVKSQCAKRGTKMADEIRTLLEGHFPKEG